MSVTSNLNPKDSFSLFFNRHLCTCSNDAQAWELRRAFNKFADFLNRHLKLAWTHENSVCYCYTSYEMTDQLL